MAKVIAQGKTIKCEKGANLRQVLLANDIDLYNSKATTINCHGIGTCGTCAVVIEGDVSEPNWRDRTRTSLPPHGKSSDRRLACQTKVLGTVRVKKYGGFWGQGDAEVWTSRKAKVARK